MAMRKGLFHPIPRFARVLFSAVRCFGECLLAHQPVLGFGRCALPFPALFGMLPSLSFIYYFIFLSAWRSRHCCYLISNITHKSYDPYGMHCGRLEVPHAASPGMDHKPGRHVDQVIPEPLESASHKAFRQGQLLGQRVQIARQHRYRPPCRVCPELAGRKLPRRQVAFEDGMDGFPASTAFASRL